jgi:hypothetical protein
MPQLKPQMKMKMKRRRRRRRSRMTKIATMIVARELLGISVEILRHL